MKYRNPSKIGRDLSVIGFGAWQLGNKEFWGEMSDEHAIELVQQAVVVGINVFDTAPGYGSGASERLLGIALKGQREKVFLNTKFGHTADGRTDFSVEALDVSINDSLARLQTTYLDSIILHNPGWDLLYGDSPIYRRLKHWKALGIIRHYGVSIDSLEELEIVLHHNDVDVIELMFNVIHQSPKVLFEEVEEKGILLMIKVPLDSGWLTGKYTKDSVFTGIRARWSDEVKQTRHDIVTKIKAIVGSADLVQPALRFILSFDAVTCVLPGTRNLKQLASNVAVAEAELSVNHKRQLEELYDTYIRFQSTPW